MRTRTREEKRGEEKEEEENELLARRRGALLFFTRDEKNDLRELPRLFFCTAAVRRSGVQSALSPTRGTPRSFQFDNTKKLGNSVAASP